MVKIGLACGHFFNVRARYVLETFFTYYRTDYQLVELDGLAIDSDSFRSLTVYYGPEPDNLDSTGGPPIILVYENSTGSFFEQNGEAPAPVMIGDAPVIFSSSQKALIENKGTSLVCRADLIATAFFFLSAYQELSASSQAVDDKGRFSLKASYQAKHGLLETPVVNLIFDLLARWLREKSVNISQALFPGGAKYALVLSHDVDRMFFFSAGGALRRIKNSLVELLRYGRVIEALNHAEGLFGNPHDTFARIIQLNRYFNVNSTFFFVFNHKLRPYDPDYLIESPPLLKIFSFLKDADCEIGLHGSYASIGQDAYSEELDYARSILGPAIPGTRIHYLRFRIQKLFEILEKTGMQYDSSLMFAEAPGFRTGFGWPHLLFNHKAGCTFPTVEIPLNLMDATLFDKRYLGLTVGEAFKKVDTLSRTAASMGLALGFLTHNDFYLRANIRAVKMYSCYLKRACKEGAWLTNPGALYNWWLQLRNRT